MGFQRGAAPFGTRFCSAKSSALYLCFRLTRERGCERLRQAPVLRQKDVQMGIAIDSLRPPSAGLQRNQWCTFSFLPQQWCCTIKVDTGNSKSQYIEKEKQEARKDGSESRVDRLDELEPYDAGNVKLSLVHVLYSRIGSIWRTICNPLLMPNLI